jgi:hypothetical protein
MFLSTSRNNFAPSPSPPTINMSEMHAGCLHGFKWPPANNGAATLREHALGQRPGELNTQLEHSNRKLYYRCGPRQNASLHMGPTLTWIGVSQGPQGGPQASRQQASGSRHQAACSRQHAAGSRQQAACIRQQAASSRQHATTYSDSKHRQQQQQQSAGIRNQASCSRQHAAGSR